MKNFTARFGAWALLISLLGSPFAPVLLAQSFTNVTDTIIPGLLEGKSYSVAWGDYDNDGRLDLLLESYFTITNHPDPQTTSTYNVPRPLLWRNTGNGFTNMPDTFAPGLDGGGAAAWADYDKDGWQDVFVLGQLWRNTGTGFVNVTATAMPGLPTVQRASAAWGDYDKDGRLDLLLAGFDYDQGGNYAPFSQVWRNTGNGFTNVTATVAPGLQGIGDGSVAWGDYDNDGRLDFIITGGIPRRSDLDDDYPYYTPISQIWRNTGSRFENVTSTVAPGLPGVFWGSVAWGDYDNDGRLDLLLTGSTRYSHFSQLWRNMGSNFVDVTASVAPGLPGIIQGPLAWGDYDNDGRLDILLSGELWRNTGSGFTNVTASVAPGLTRVVSSDLAWGDYDNDGRLDFLLTGSTYFYCDGCDAPPRVAQLWRNITAVTNAPPVVITSVPTGVAPMTVTLSASIHPHRQATAGWFIWGSTTNYGQMTAAQPMGNGNSFTNCTQAITGLSTGVTYYYRAVGSNAQGQVILGAEQRFVLSPPGVTTSPVADFRPNTVVIKGSVTPNNLPTYGWFQWGFTPALEQVTPVQFLGNGFDANLSQDLYGLPIGTNFYFRVAVSNGLGVAYGATQSLVMIDAPFVCPGSSLSPSSKSVGNAGGTGYSTHALLPCLPWIVINTNSWITITSPTNGTTLESSLTFNVAVNTNPLPRGGNITIGGQNFFVTQAAGNPGCTTYISPGSVSRGYGAAMGTVSVGAGMNCAWDAVNTNSWITILSGASGVGNGQVVYAIEENSDIQSRNGNITIGGRICRFTQYGHSYVSLPDDQVVALGGTATFSVTVNITPPFTCHWQFNGVDLVDGAGISGAATTNLVLTGVQYSQAGHYRCVASNAYGGQYFGSSATLTVAPTSNALSIAEALDTDDMFFWKTWSDSTGIWFGQTNTTHDGLDALECSGLAAGEFASLETKSGGPGLLSFWWKTAFATPSDRLLFWIGSYQPVVVTNTTDWEQRSFTVPPGDANLHWTFSNSSTGNQSRAWLDQVQFSPCNFSLSPSIGTIINSLASTGKLTLTAAADCPWNVVNTNSWITITSSVTNHGSGSVFYSVAFNNTPLDRSGNIVIAEQNYFIYQGGRGSLPTNAEISLVEALDTEGSLEWSTIGTPAWFGQKIVSRDGIDAAQSGPIGDSTAVTATTFVNWPGTVLFWWKVSSETNKDYLKFFINGVQQTRISGETDWQLLSYDLTSITNTLKWTYSKNASVAVGQDRGWLDQVQFVPALTTGGCVKAVSPISALHSASSETGLVSVMTAPGCEWNVVNTNSWITYTASSGESNGLVRYTLSTNSSHSVRTGVLFIGGRPFTVTQLNGLPLCSYSLSANSISHGSPAGSGTITVTTQPGCEWNVSTTNAWITITSVSANSGTGQFTYSVSENTSSMARNGQVRISDQILTLSQSGAPITLPQALDTVGSPLAWITAGNGPWFGQSAVTHDGVDAAQSGAISSGAGSLQTTVTGPGTLTFWWKISSPETNSDLRFFVGSSQTARIFGEVDWQQQTVTIPPGVYYLLWIYTRTTGFSSGQNSCWVDQVQFFPTPVCPVTLSPSNALHSSSSSTGLVSIAAASNCTWIVSNTNNWISISSGSNGTGNGLVNYVLTSNSTSFARSGKIQIADQTFLVTQASGVTNPPPACTISISPGSRTHGYASASNTVAVTTQPGCAWTVATTNSWINILSSLNNSNSGTVTYTIAANTNIQSRSGSIIIGGQNFLLTQSGTSTNSTNGARLQFMARTATNVTLSVQGAQGKMYVLESSADLIQWTPVSTNSAPSTVTDAPVANAPRRFYRTVEIP